MQQTSAELSVRQHERYACSLQCTVAVAPVSAERVRLARSVAGTNGTVQAKLSDCSQGGLGIHCATYFPGTCRLIARVVDDRGAVIVEAHVRVARATMSDRTPTYYLGTVLEKTSEGSIERLLEAARAATEAGGGSGGAGVARA